MDTGSPRPDMMDGRIGAIRVALDDQGFSNVGIMAYSAKYASCFLRAVPWSAQVRAGKGTGCPPDDKKTYQMDPANIREAMKEIALDIEEGADVVMVKPALPYLDVIASARQSFETPIAAYNVSGEYGIGPCGLGARLGGEGARDGRNALRPSSGPARI